MRVALIFPFPWRPTSPPCGIAVLAAILHRAGLEVRTLDLNARFHRYLLRPAFLRSLAHRLQRRSARPEMDALAATPVLLKLAANEVGGLAEAMRRGVPQRESRELAATLDRTLASLSPAFGGMSVGFGRLAAEEPLGWQEDALEQAEALGRSPWGEFAEQVVLPELCDWQPQLIGISVLCCDQAAPAVHLARALRRRLPAALQELEGAVSALEQDFGQAVSALVARNNHAGPNGQTADRAGDPLLSRAADSTSAHQGHWLTQASGS